jgi:hypothetical protein
MKNGLKQTQMDEGETLTGKIDHPDAMGEGKTERK